MISLKIGGIIVTAFIAGAFVASPELRAYAANTVGSSDIIDESILSQDIKNGEVKSVDIGTSAVINSKLAPGSVTYSKIRSNSIDGSKILDNSITAADIGPDAVRASELAGVTKLMFSTCTITSTSVSANAIFSIPCDVPGVVPIDHIVGSQDSNICFAITQIEPGTDSVRFHMHNACNVQFDVGTMVFTMVIFQN